MRTLIIILLVMLGCSSIPDYPLPYHSAHGVTVEHREARGPIAEAGWDNGTPVVWRDPFKWDTLPGPVKVAVIEHEFCHLDNGPDELAADCCAGERSRLTTSGATEVAEWLAGLPEDPNHPYPAARASEFLSCWLGRRELSTQAPNSLHKASSVAFVTSDSKETTIGTTNFYALFVGWVTKLRKSANTAPRRI